jgi:ankyrin repeat protein
MSYRLNFNISNICPEISVDQLSEGLCVGFASCYAQAVFCGQHTIFNEQIELLNQESWLLCGKIYTSITDVIEAAKDIKRDRYNSGGRYQAQKYIDTLAFVGALIGFHYGNGFFGSERISNLTITAPWFIPKSLAPNTHWHKLYQATLNITPEGVTKKILQIFTSAKEKMCEPHNDKIVILVSARYHMMALSMNKTGTLIIHNSGTTLSYTGEIEYQVTEQLYESFGFKLDDDDNAQCDDVSIEVYTMPSFLKQPILPHFPHPVVKYYFKNIQKYQQGTIIVKSLQMFVQLYASGYNGFNNNYLNPYLLSTFVNMIISLTLLNPLPQDVQNPLEEFYIMNDAPLESSVFEYIIDQPSNTVLSHACYDQKQLSLVKNMLEDNKKSAILFRPFRENDLTLAVAMLEQSTIDVNQGDNDYELTPFLYACIQGHLALVLVLLVSKKVDVNKANLGDETPLYIACDHNFIDIVRALLTNLDIDVNKADENGETPLYAACKQGHIKVVELLRANNRVDVNKADQNGKTPLYAACEQGHVNVVEALLATFTIDVNKADQNGETPLYAACKEGHVKVVEALLLLATFTINVNKADRNGETPLYAACEQGHIKVVEVLVLLAKFNIDVNKADINGETPLYAACKEGHVNVVQTMLIYAARGVRDVYMLLPHQLKVYVNQADKNGDTPFHAACKEGHVQVVQALLANQNVDPNLPRIDGTTPFQTASANPQNNIIIELIGHPRIDFSRPRKARSSK